ncbi:DUF6773 family protein [Blautia stercoris]|jgi:hypothetical protein
MRNKKVKDERIIQVQNKILGEAYFVTVLLLFISILVKAYVMKCDYTNYITELIIIILSAIYIAVRSMMCGNNLMDTSKRNKTLCVLGAFGASIVITAINGVRNYTNYGEHYSGLLDWHFLATLAVTFISSFVLISIGILFVYLCHQKGQQRIEKKLNDDIEED